LRHTVQIIDWKPIMRPSFILYKKMRYLNYGFLVLFLLVQALPSWSGFHWKNEKGQYQFSLDKSPKQTLGRATTQNYPVSNNFPQSNLNSSGVSSSEPTGAYSQPIASEVYNNPTSTTLQGAATQQNNFIPANNGSAKLEEFAPHEQKTFSSGAEPDRKLGSLFKRPGSKGSKLESEGSFKDKLKDREERKKTKAHLKEVEKETKLMKEQQKMRDTMMTKQVKLYELGNKPSFREKMLTKLKPGKQSNDMLWQASSFGSR
jgi:hypothetical protein